MNEVLVERFIDNVKYLNYREILDCENALKKIKALRIDEMEFSLNELKGVRSKVSIADHGWGPAPEKQTIEEVFMASGLEGGKRYRLKQMEKIVGDRVRTKDKAYDFWEAVNILRDKGIITSGNGFWCFNDSMV